MSVQYRIKTVVCQNGERLPLLIDSATGVPLFDVTVYILTKVRGKHRAARTIEQVLRAIKVFLLFLEIRGIFLEKRLQNGQIFELAEIDALVALCRRPLEDIESDYQHQIENSRAVLTGSGQVIRMPASSGKAAILVTENAPDTIAVRVLYIAEYLEWLVDRALLRLSNQAHIFAQLSEIKNIVVSALKERAPTAGGKPERLALTEEQQDRLLQAIDPASPENPWVGDHARARNELMVRWFFGLGLRRGELAGVEILNINFQKLDVLIPRKPINKADPRRDKPGTKTKAKSLPLNDDLVRRTQDYIIKYRRSFKRARQHGFLFVANGGRPLSLRAINKVFEVLRERCPFIPKETVPHLLRHTWSTNLLEEMKKNKVPSPDAAKFYKELGGWSSDMEETYNQAGIRRGAREASLGLQEKMKKPIHDD